MDRMEMLALVAEQEGEGPRCMADTSKGDRCQVTTGLREDDEGLLVCAMHDADRLAKLRKLEENLNEGLDAGGTSFPLKSAPKTAAQARRVMGWVTYETGLGRMPPKVTSALTQACRTFIETIKVSDLEAKLTKAENMIKDLVQSGKVNV